jgi:RNA polymerase primary sigma factor
MRQLKITSSITNRESQSLETYFSEIGKVDLITAQEEVILAQKIREGDQAALERLTRANLRFVVSVAKKYQHQGLPLGDLINEGNLGLIKAASRFDDTRGFKFISFAVWWIRQSIMAAITENARMVRLPMNKVGEITRINRAAAELEQQTLREPTAGQLAEYLDMPLEKVSDALFHAPWTGSYDAPFGGEEEFSMLDVLCTTENPADELLSQEDFTCEFNRLLRTLSANERQILELTYGLTRQLEMSAAEIGRYLRLNAEKVRYIRKQALGKLRQAAPVML